MSEDIQLLVSCHKPDIHIPDNPLLRPIQVGAALNGRIDGMLHDDEGDNISAKNRSYCELTAQYWAWKHLDADYYGFMHYRRYFNFSDTTYPIHHEPFIFGDVVFDRNDDETLSRIGFEEERMREVITAHDFIAPEPIATPDSSNVYDQYRESVGHHIEDLDTVLAVIKARYPEIWPSAQRYLAQDRLYVCNMFVMRKDLFRAYSEWLFDILSAHERLSNDYRYSLVGRRVSGYLGERLCGIYLTYLYDSGRNGLNLQRTYFRDPNEPGTSSSVSPVMDRRIGFGAVTRGSGKIFSAIELSPELAGQDLSARSEVDGGLAVPAKIVESDGRKVLVIPVLSVDQMVTVEARDEGGRLLASNAKKFTPTAAKLQSQKNTLLKNAAANAIRNCDSRSLPHDGRVDVQWAIRDVDGTEIVRAVANTSLDPGESADAFVEVKVLGLDGRPIGVGDWTCLCEKVRSLSEYPGQRVRELIFAQRIPVVPSYIVWVRYPDGEYPDAFTCVEPFRADGLRNDYKNRTLPACENGAYNEWFLDRHRASQTLLDVQRRRAFDNGVTFSVIVPLYRTPIQFFREMVDSVVAQTYSGWELILVNASPEDDALAAEIESRCAADERIRCVTLSENRGITENTNEGIKVAKGDFLSFLDHDDTLEPDCLYDYAAALEKDSEIDLLYCDEDKLEDGVYKMPFFKPDWNPDLLLGMNYVCHFLTVRRAIVEGMELPTNEYDGSQDWHMTFRVGELARKIHHCPRVLYHWRIHENSTAKSADQKDYTLDSSRLAVSTHLERMGIRGTVEDSPLSPRRFKIAYDLGSRPLVSIVIPNKDSFQALNRCLLSVLNHSSYDNFEVVIVENNSTDPDTFAYYDEVVKLDSRVRVVTFKDMTGFNYSRLMNYGISCAKGEYILMLNNDTEVISTNWIEELLGTCMRKDVGIVGARLYFPDDAVQHAWVSMGGNGPVHKNSLLARREGANFESALLARDVSAVTGACLMTSKEDFDAMGGLDEEFAVNYNDTDYCYRMLERGKRVVYCPTAELYHRESVTRGTEEGSGRAIRTRTELARLMMRWPEMFEEIGPFDNPNLTSRSPYECLEPFPKREEWEA